MSTEANTERVGQILRKQLVESVKQGVDSKQSTFLLSYSAISSLQMSDLRKKLSDLGAEVRVSKNRLAKLALKELEQETLSNEIEGQIAFVWSDSDSAAISKALTDFAKVCEGLQIKGGILDGNTLHKSDVQRLADLPSREVLQSQLLAVIQAPITRLMGAMNAKSRELLSILKQLSEKKEGGN